MLVVDLNESVGPHVDILSCIAFVTSTMRNYTDLCILFISILCLYVCVCNTQGSIVMSQRKKAVSASQNKTQRVSNHTHVFKQNILMLSYEYDSI